MFFRLLSSVEFYYHLLTELIRVSVSDIEFFFHWVEALTALVPCLPVVITRTLERMVRVSLRLPHLYAPAAYSLLTCYADVGLLGTEGTLLFRDQPQEWARCTAVRLLHR